MFKEMKVRDLSNLTKVKKVFITGFLASKVNLHFCLVVVLRLKILRQVRFCDRRGAVNCLLEQERIKKHKSDGTFSLLKIHT